MSEGERTQQQPRVQGRKVPEREHPGGGRGKFVKGDESWWYAYTKEEQTAAYLLALTRLFVYERKEGVRKVMCKGMEGKEEYLEYTKE